MKTDNQIQKDVMEELKWEPSLIASQIGVAVKNGIVTLSGQVDSLYKKMVAEKVAKKVGGVKAVAEDIQVGISPNNRRTDTEIAQAVLDALKWHSAIQEEKIKIKVEDGVVKLEGEVEWEYQRINVKSAIQNLIGVKSVINLVTVKPKVKAGDVQRKIRESFIRNASIDAEKISIDVNGSKVILRGRVRSLAEKEDAERAAWAAPGVASLESNILVETPEYAMEAQ